MLACVGSVVMDRACMPRCDVAGIDLKLGMALRRTPVRSAGILAGDFSRRGASVRIFLFRANPPAGSQRDGCRGFSHVESVVMFHARMRRCDVARGDAKCGERVRRTGARMRQGLNVSVKLSAAVCRSASHFG